MAVAHVELMPATIMGAFTVGSTLMHVSTWALLRVRIPDESDVVHAASASEEMMARDAQIRMTR